MRTLKYPCYGMLLILLVFIASGCGKSKEDIQVEEVEYRITIEQLQTIAQRRNLPSIVRIREKEFTRNDSQDPRGFVSSTNKRDGTNSSETIFFNYYRDEKEATFAEKGYRDDFAKVSDVNNPLKYSAVGRACNVVWIYSPGSNFTTLTLVKPSITALRDIQALCKQQKLPSVQEVNKLQEKTDLDTYAKDVLEKINQARL